MSTTLGRVTRVKGATNPYLHLAAGVLACAIDDARNGCAEARRWLQGDARLWIELLAPDGVDPDELHRLILSHAANGSSPLQLDFETLVNSAVDEEAA